MATTEETAIDHSAPGPAWAIEPLKQIIIKAMVDHAKGAGMAVTARIAVDATLAYLEPVIITKET